MTLDDQVSFTTFRKPRMSALCLQLTLHDQVFSKKKKNLNQERSVNHCMRSLLYCLAWCCRWSRELCLSRSCMISFGAVLYEVVTVLLGLVL